MWHRLANSLYLWKRCDVIQRETVYFTGSWSHTAFPCFPLSFCAYPASFLTLIRVTLNNEQSYTLTLKWNIRNMPQVCQYVVTTRFRRNRMRTTFHTAIKSRILVYAYDLNCLRYKFVVTCTPFVNGPSSTTGQCTWDLLKHGHSARFSSEYVGFPCHYLSTYLHFYTLIKSYTAHTIQS